MRHGFDNLLRRLSRAGFKKDFVESALLPDWWEPSCAKDAALLPEIEVRVARFLGVTISQLRDSTQAIRPPAYAHAQLRSVRYADRDRLTPAIHAAVQVAGAVVRSLRSGVPAAEVPPSDGLAWRSLLSSDGRAPSLGEILDDLWRRGIPVVPVDVLPTPSFQAMACIAENRPVVLLVHKYDEPGRLAHFIGHEVGHIVAADCTADAPVIDDEGDVGDDVGLERAAERFAVRLLVGADAPPQIDGGDWAKVAKRAAQVELEQGVEAGSVIFAWARSSGDYATATRAVKALYRSTGGRRLLLQSFEQWVDREVASESDRALLRCVSADQLSDANPD